MTTCSIFMCIITLPTLYLVFSKLLFKSSHLFKPAPSVGHHERDACSWPTPLTRWTKRLLNDSVGKPSGRVGRRGNDSQDGGFRVQGLGGVDLVEHGARIHQHLPDVVVIPPAGPKETWSAWTKRHCWMDTHVPLGSLGLLLGWQSTGGNSLLTQMCFEGKIQKRTLYHIFTLCATTRIAYYGMLCVCNLAQKY